MHNDEAAIQRNLITKTTQPYNSVKIPHPISRFLATVCGIVLGFSLPFAVLAAPFDEWTWIFPRPTGADLYAITYGEGKFVAVGSYGVVLISTDGRTWTEKLAPKTITLRAVTYADSKFVMVGDGGTILLMSGSGEFQEVSSGVNATLLGVGWGNRTFVAVGTLGTILTSQNGTNWIRKGIPGLAGVPYLSSVTFGADRFIIVGGNFPGDGSSTSTILTSQDGVAWSLVDHPQTYYRSSITFGGGKFYATGSTGFSEVIIGVSNDGLIWTNFRSVVDGDGAALNCSSFGNNLFVAASPSLGRFFVAKDGMNGLTWTGVNTRQIYTSDYRLRFMGMAFGNGEFVAVGEVGRIYASTNGIDWAERFLPSPLYRDGSRHSGRTIIQTIRANGEFIAASFDSVLDNKIAQSSDGLSWETIASVGRVQLKDIASSGDTLVAVGWNIQGGFYAIHTSLDGGRSWFTYASAYGSERVVAKDGKIVVLGNSTLLFSANGLDWDVIPAGRVSKIAVAEEGFIAGTFRSGAWTGSPSFLRSSDGRRWTTKMTSMQGDIQGIAQGNGVFIALNDEQEFEEWRTGSSPGRVRLYVSTDGNTWTNSFTMEGSPYDVVFTDGYFAAATSAGLFVSTNGTNWVKKLPFRFSRLSAADGIFVATGEYSVLVSGKFPPPPLRAIAAWVQGGLEITTESSLTRSLTVQASTNLIQWSDLGTLSTSAPRLLDPSQKTQPSRFYRLKSP